MVEGEKERPSRELTTQSNTHPKEQSGAYKEAATNTRHSSSLMQEQQRWYEWSHEKIVKEFKDYVQQKNQLFGGAYSPEEIIRMRLDQENSAHLASPNKKEGSFFFQLKQAWDALAYDRYEPGSSEENLAARSLNYYYGCTDGGPTIKLSHPAQVRIIDALTEAIGIPHQKGQVEIEIPDKIKHYDKWIFSKEYREQVAKVKSQRNK